MSEFLQFVPQEPRGAQLMQCIGATAETPIRNPWTISSRKRIFDLFVAAAVVVVFCVPMLILGIVVRLTSPGHALFVQHRVGRNGKQFRILKFRTMASFAEESVIQLTAEGDARLTRVGAFMRKFKLDELPQFINVLRGDMSLVGPRPKLPRYAESLDMPYRPGLTGAATLTFRNEEKLLQTLNDPSEMDKFYMTHIMPAKARLDRRYMETSTFRSDFQILLATVFSCIRVPLTESPAALETHLPENATNDILTALERLPYSN